jgi:hypothetical protein
MNGDCHSQDLYTSKTGLFYNDEQKQVAIK